MFTSAELLTATGGRWDAQHPAFEVHDIVTDSRDNCTDALFIALKGENFDGHNFLMRAVEKGARALCVAAGAVTAKEYGEYGVPVLMVEDTLKAYKSIAKFHRHRFPELKIVAVTGSVGKTSVKEIVRSILCAWGGEARVLWTEGNTNNHIGVPKNLLRLEESHSYAVLEAGSSSPGEIETLSLLIEPDIAIVNSIAPCHLEKLGDLAGVAAEKGKIFSGLKKDGVAIIPAQCEKNEILRAAAKEHCILRFGSEGEEDCDAYVSYLGGDLDGSSFLLFLRDRCEELTIEWPLSGAHQARNAACAALVASALEIPTYFIREGLKNVRLPGMRMLKSKARGALIINDAYNANPASMEALINEFAQSTSGGKNLIVILGDMLELGSAEESGHRAVVDLLLGKLPQAQKILIGPRFAKAARDAGKESFDLFLQAPDAKDYLDTLELRGKTILLKGSRGMRLEDAIAFS